MKNPVYRNRNHVTTFQMVTRLLLSYRGDRKEIVGRVSLVVQYIHEFYRGKIYHKGKDFVLLGGGTYFTEYDTIRYSTVVVIIYDNTLHPMTTEIRFFALKRKKYKVLDSGQDGF